MSTQPPPTASQRRHRYVYVCGCAPPHEPRFAVSVWFCCGVPEIVGGLVLAGADDACTTPGVAFEFALELPSAFDAVTCERMRCPTSAARNTYALCVACEIAAQLTPLTPPPLVSQRSQR